MANSLLKYLNLSDRYELKTRIMPGLIIGLPAAFGAISFCTISSMSKEVVAIASLAFAALVLWIAHLSRGAGISFEKRLVLQWGGLPTTRWLRPSDTSHSPEQKAIWTKALTALSGIDIASAIVGRSSQDVDKVITDAVLSTRGVFRKSKSSEAKFLQTTNEEYGFARNLGGMKWAALASGGIGLALTIFAVWLGKATTFHLIIGSILMLAVVVQFRAAESQTLHCAERYAEAFFAAVTGARKPKGRETE